MHWSSTLRQVNSLRHHPNSVRHPPVRHHVQRLAPNLHRGRLLKRRRLETPPKIVFMRDIAVSPSDRPWYPDSPFHAFRPIRRMRRRSSSRARSLSENSICALKIDEIGKVYGRKTLAIPPILSIQTLFSDRLLVGDRPSCHDG